MYPKIDKAKLQKIAFNLLEFLIFSVTIFVGVGYGAFIQYSDSNWLANNLNLIIYSFWAFFGLLFFKYALKGYFWFKNRKITASAQ